MVRAKVNNRDFCEHSHIKYDDQDEQPNNSENPSEWFSWWTTPSIDSHCFGVHTEGTQKRKHYSGNEEPERSISNSSKHCQIIKKYLLKESPEGDQLIKWEPSILQQFENQWQLGYPTYMPTNSLFDQPFRSSNANVGTFVFFHFEGLKPLWLLIYLIFERGIMLGNS